jgi:hypothetical protein
MTGDRCVACLDPTPKGWRYCVKCHLWSSFDRIDEPNFFRRLHPALEWLDWQRRRPSSSNDLAYLVRRLERRIEELEQKGRI